MLDNRVKTVYTMQRRKSKSSMLSSEAKGNTITREYKGATYDNLYFHETTNMPGSFHINVQKKTSMLNRIASRGH